MKQTIAILLVHYGSWNQASSAPLLGSTTSSWRRKSFLPNTRKTSSFITRRNTISSCCFLSYTSMNSRPRIHHRQTYPTSIHDERLDPSHSHCNLLSLSVSSSPNNIIEETAKREEKAERHNNRTNKSGARKTKKKKNNNDIIGGTKRMKKSDINDLVRGIGLQPVVVQSTPSKKKKKALSTTAVIVQQQEPVVVAQLTPSKKREKALKTLNSDSRHPQQNNIDPLFIKQQQSPPPAISLQTQLNYSRNGHTVLRSFLPQTLIHQLRSELLPHAASHEVAAWRQKVEVQLADSSESEYYRENARTIAAGLKSVEECQELLESLGMDPLAGDLPFLQHFNAWRAGPPTTSTTANKDANSNNNPLGAVRKLCLSSHLAQTASILLDTTSTIRLYQDSLFHKRAGDGWTPWHSDARMAPFDTSNMITFWIPLQTVPKPGKKGGTGLHFVDGSHADIALPYWNGGEGDEYDRLESRYESNIGGGGVSHHMPLAVGDVTVHNGWTLHCADAAVDEDGGEDRYAFSVTYVDGRAELREDVLPSSETNMDNNSVRGGDVTDGSTPTAKGDKEDVWSFRSWVEEVKPRTEFRHPMVPIVWPPEQRDDVVE